MNALSSRAALAGLVFLSLLLTAGHSQIQPAPSRLTPSERIAREKQTAAASRASLLRQDFAAAEQVLEQSSTAARGSAALDLDTARSLGRMAAEFNARRDTATSAVLARRTLARLASAQAKLGASAPQAQLANILELSGFYTEYYLGDYAAARSYYAAAIRLAPSYGQSAEALARLNAMEAEAARKNRNAKN